MLKKLMLLLIPIVVVIFILLLRVNITSQNDYTISDNTLELIREQPKEDLASEGNLNNDTNRYMEGEILVKFKEDIDSEKIDKFLSDYTLEVINVLEEINIYKLKISTLTTVKDVLEVISKDERIDYAEPVYIFQIYI